MPSPGRDQARGPRSGCPPAPGPRAGPGRPRAARPPGAAFSVEAILARPAPRAPACAAASARAWGAPSPPPGPGLPWAGPAPWPPAGLGLLGLGLSRPGPPPPALGLRPAPLGGVTGLELTPCPGLWSPPDGAPREDLQDAERPHKRVRTMFNLEQLEELEKVFAKQHNLVGKSRAQLAARLRLTENQVRVWFQNRRVKYQKQQRLKPPAVSATAASPDEPSSSSDAVVQREDTESGGDS